MLSRVPFLVIVLACWQPGWGQKYYAWVGTLGPDSALLAWGATTGTNTIGRSSPSHGQATIKIDGRTLTSTQNWIVVTGLAPDREYTYEISLNGRSIAANKFRTWSDRANKVAFFVIGDYGNGSPAQFALARAMLEEFTRRSGSSNPIRFVLTTGDNIYGDENFFLGARNTGADDRDWATRFFEPYQGLIAHVPFYPTLGNHDGNESESRHDLAAYLDNFFFPNNQPARYYSFTYGGFADFFALDSTTITAEGRPRAAYLESGDQWKWMQQALSRSTARWKIPYYHHPVFTAGPEHPPSLNELRHWIPLFSQAGVRTVFNGHEHNFQYSAANPLSGGIRFIISGAGGQLRDGKVSRYMRSANIEGWSPRHHFLVVEIEDRTMRITPLSSEPMQVVDENGKPIAIPLTVTLP